MKRVALLLLALSVVACASRGTAQPQPAQAVPQPQAVPEPPLTQLMPEPSEPRPVQAPPAPPREEGPDLAWLAVNLTRDQLRGGLLRLMNGPGADPGAKLAAVFDRLGNHPYGPPALPYAQADLDGNGEQEYVMALRIIDSDRTLFRAGEGAGLFVIYRRDGRWAVDRTDPMSDLAEIELMAPALNAVTDLAGAGRPQIVWSRPEMIATGRQPTFFFVTAWKPGAFTQLPGEMAISNGAKDHAMLTIEGKELVLTGGSRNQMFLPEHTDRYRYGDGAFRLTDRRFIGAGDSGYDRLWDGLAAEQVGRTADAERNYREAADPARTPHSGTVLHYAMAPLELSPGELERFGQALRAFARFRLAAMLKETKGEALTARDDPYADLLAAMKKATTRKAGCQAASAWAQAHPAFLKAFNLGGGWPPDLSLCGHMRFEDSLDAPQP